MQCLGTIVCAYTFEGINKYLGKLYNTYAVKILFLLYGCVSRLIITFVFTMMKLLRFHGWMGENDKGIVLRKLLKNGFSNYQQLSAIICDYTWFEGAKRMKMVYNC